MVCCHAVTVHFLLHPFSFWEGEGEGGAGRIVFKRTDQVAKVSVLNAQWSVTVTISSA